MHPKTVNTQPAPRSHALRPLLLALLLSGISLGSAALDLRGTYDAALENDATIRAARATLDAERERLPQARAQLLPNIGLSGSRNKNKLETTSSVQGRESVKNDDYMSGSLNLTLRQPIYRKYQSDNLRQAGVLVQGAEATLQRELQNLTVRVGVAYFEALLARDQLELLGAQKRLTQTQVEAATKSFGAGAGTRTDIDEAQARLDMTLAQELEARQNVEFTANQIQVLTNQPVGVLAGVDVAQLQLLTPEPNELARWVERAEQNSPEMVALKAQLDATRIEVDKAQAGHYPTLDGVLQFSRSDSENVTSVNNRYDTKSIGVQLSIPLYAGGAVNSQVRQALAQVQRSEEALEATRRDLGVRVHREFRGVTEGIQKIRALEQALRSAEQVVVSTNKSFLAGLRTRLDILNAEQQKMVTQRDLAQARYLYLVSRIRLKSLASDDSAASLTEINGWLVR